MFGLQIGAPLICSLVAAGLYAAGIRRGLRPVGGASPEARRMRQRRALTFAAALLVLVVALASPLDDAADELFWAHMSQHMLLMMVAAPLLVLAAPWMALWRPFPLGARRGVAGFTTGSPWFAPFRWLARPLGACLAFNIVLWAWHLPALYDLTLSNQAVHDFEHFTMLAAGVLLWAQLIDSPPLHARLDVLGRGLVAFVCIVSSWVLAVVLAMWPSPLYDYAHLASRPGGISALTDQQLAAGIMWGPGAVPLSVIVFLFIYQFLDDAERPRRRESGSVTRLAQEKGA